MSQARRTHVASSARIAGVLVAGVGLFAAVVPSSAQAAAASTSGAAGTQESIAQPLHSCPPTIGVGSAGYWVKVVQKRLNWTYSPHLKVDGVFGAKTEKHVNWYQNGHHLTADGVVGPKTWHMMGHC